MAEPVGDMESVTKSVLYVVSEVLQVCLAHVCVRSGWLVLRLYILVHEITEGESGLTLPRRRTAGGRVLK
jgi:hypothetical protein